MTQPSRVAKLARLMAPDLKFIKPGLLAERQETIAGNIGLSALQRLREMFSVSDNVVEYTLRFSKDNEGFIIILGGFSVTFNMVCQRCLNPVDIEVANTISLGIVADQTEVNRLPAQYESLVLTEDQISLLKLIEDEVLLSLPISPLHRLEECPSDERFKDKPQKKVNPFAVLKDLKLKKS